MPIANKRGNKHYREVLVDRPFRLVIVKSKTEESKEYWLLTNEFDLPAKEIAQPTAGAGTSRYSFGSSNKNST